MNFRNTETSGLNVRLDKGVIRESIRMVYPTDSLDILQLAGAENGVQISILAEGGKEYTTSQGQHAIVPYPQTYIEISHQEPSLNAFWVKVSELHDQRQQEQIPS